MFELTTADPTILEPADTDEAAVRRPPGRPPAREPVDTVALSRAHLSPAMARYFHRAWSHGDGHRLHDVDGRAYLDFACGIAVTILGHRHPAVTEAIRRQSEQLLHVSNGLGYLEPVARLAAMLADTLPAPLDTVFFLNSGTEAVEAALKLARRVTGRPGIIAFSGAFHGRTYGSLSVTTSSANYQAGHGPLLPGVYVAPFPLVWRDHAGDEAAASAAGLDAVRRLLADAVAAQDVAAFIVEPVQGEGGYHPAPAGFLPGLRALCDEHGILLIADEVQSGYGRTGQMWAFEHDGVVPDVVCVAKGIANGLPLGAMVSRRDLQERWGLGAHGSTFGGNPVSCAAGIAVLETIAAQELLANAAARGAEIEAGLRALAAGDPRIGDVRGRGLMLGVEFVTDSASREPDGALADAVIARCLDEGLVLLTCGPQHNVVRWIAPLDVTSDEVQEALGIFARVLAG